MSLPAAAACRAPILPANATAVLTGKTPSACVDVPAEAYSYAATQLVATIEETKNPAATAFILNVEIVGGEKEPKTVGRITTYPAGKAARFAVNLGGRLIRGVHGQQVRFTVLPMHGPELPGELEVRISQLVWSEE